MGFVSILQKIKYPITEKSEKMLFRLNFYKLKLIGNN